MSKPVLSVSLNSKVLLTDLRDDLVEALDEENLAHFLASVAKTGGTSVPLSTARLLVEYLVKSSPKERPFDVNTLLYSTPPVDPSKPSSLPPNPWPFPTSSRRWTVAGEEEAPF